MNLESPNSASSLAVVHVHSQLCSTNAYEYFKMHYLTLSLFKITRGYEN